jgi:hypothetical protein
MREEFDRLIVDCEIHPLGTCHRGKCHEGGRTTPFCCMLRASHGAHTNAP